MTASSDIDSECPNTIRQVLTLKIDGVAANLGALKDLLNERDRLYGQRFDSMDKANAVALAAVRDATNAALTAAKEAVLKAETANERRFESMNEFRGQLRDMIATLSSKDEVMVRFHAVEDKITLVNERVNLMRGHSEGANWLWVIIASVIGIAFGIIGTISQNR